MKKTQKEEQEELQEEQEELQEEREVVVHGCQTEHRLRRCLKRADD